MRLRAFLATLVLFSVQNAQAGNGVYCIGLSPVSESLGGTGTAGSTRTTDAFFKNVALIGREDFALSTKNESHPLLLDASTALVKLNPTSNAGAGVANSSANIAALPRVSAAYVVSPELAFGLGLIAVGGNTVDYKGNTSLLEVQSQLALARLALGMSAEVAPKLRVGIAPFLVYGELNINEASSGTQSRRAPHGSVGYGAQFGAAYEAREDLVLGASFTTKQPIRYKQILTLDLFGPLPGLTSELNDLPVENPMEIAFGAAWKASTEWTLSVDYRFIGWASADIYKELGWNNQHVIGIGAEYKWPSWALRFGFNYAGSPIGETDSENGESLTSFAGHNVLQRRISQLNAFAFPAFASTHFTVGAGTNLTESLKLDGSVMYSPKTTTRRKGLGGARFPGEAGTYEYTGTMTQWAASVGLTLAI